MRRSSLTLLLAMSLAAGGLLADEPTRVLVQTDSAAILAQQQAIRRDAAARTGRYKAMRPQQLEQLQREQDTVERLLAGTTHTTDLPADSQTEVFNALEAISALLNKAEDERLVCESYKPVGSHRKRTTCRTVAQIRAQRERDTDTLQRRDQQCTSGWSTPACP